VHEGGRPRRDPVDGAAERVELYPADAARRVVRSASTPLRSAPMPWPFSGAVKKSDLENCACRFSVPPLAYQGRWQAW
jgi:hypothetical protein